MSLAAGTRIGSYEILAPLGAGGMGEVYRARDTKLGREVALKILPDLVASDADRRARFTREAHVLASLNHPHIAHLYGFEAGPPTSFLVMELVEGPTLAELITATPNGLPLEQVLPIARQIAEALETAHEHGVIHRDLKPANIKVRDDGVVKVLDFGLAKALDPMAGSNVEAMNSPTMTVRATQMGMIIGTAAYMAPEQARGKVVDRRADIWAFGVVLTELLTGDRAFRGEDVTEVLAKVIEREPDLSKLPAATPPSLRRLIERCLMKDPKQRLRDIGEARIALAEAERELARGPASASGAAASTSVIVLPLWRRALPWALAAVSLLGALAVVLIRGGSSPLAPAALMRLQIALPPGVELYTFYGASVSLSPDGKTLAFVAVADGIRRVYQRRLDQFEIAPVPGTERATSVAFSPDGRQLLVGGADNSLYRIRLSDFLNETVVTTSGEYRAAWLPNDQVVFSKDGRLWMSGATPGAPPTQLTQAQTGSTAMEMQPVPVPGGKAVLFVSARPEASDSGRIEALSLTDKVRTTVVERASSPVLTSTGDLLFLRDGVLLAAPFDIQSLKTTGDATPVLSDLSVDHSRAAPAGIMAVSRTGVLAYASTTAVPGDIVSVSRGREEQVARSPRRSATNPRMSPTGQRLVYEEIGNGLWVWDLGRPTPARLAEGNPSAQFPIFTRAGREIIFRTPVGLFRQPLDGGAKPAQIAGSGGNEFPSGTTLNDAELLYTKITATTSGDIYATPLGGGTPRALVNTPAYEGGAEISPDGHWMVYVSNEIDGVSEIFVKPYPSLAGRTQVSSGGGIQPAWNPKGLEIVYRNGDKMMSVRLRVTPTGPDPAPPVEVFSRRYAFGNGNTIPNFSMTNDGEHFILVKQQSGASLNVVLNWFETLKRVK